MGAADGDMKLQDPYAKQQVEQGFSTRRWVSLDLIVVYVDSGEWFALYKYQITLKDDRGAVAGSTEYQGWAGNTSNTADPLPSWSKKPRIDEKDGVLAVEQSIAVC